MLKKRHSIYNKIYFLSLDYFKLFHEKIQDNVIPEFSPIQHFAYIFVIFLMYIYEFYTRYFKPELFYII